MLKPVFVACLAALGTFAIVVGCTAPSTDGDVNNKTSRGAGDDDDTTSGTSGKSKGTSSGTTSSGSTEVQGDCSGREPADDRPQCDQCARTKCCNQYAFLLDDNGCKLQKKCIDDCKGEPFCQLTCLQTTGSEKCLEFSQCIQANCGNQCPSTGDAGSFEDPFGDDDAG